MGMPFNQFIRNTVNDILQGKHSFFLCHTGMEYYLHQDVSQFFRHTMGIFIVHRLQEFIALFYQIRPDRVKILLPVPGASARFTQHLHHVRKRAHIKLCFVP